MRIELENRHLVESMKFLESLTLKAKASRHRTKLINVLSSHFEQLCKDELALLKEYGAVSEDDHIIKDIQGDIDIKDKLGFNRDHAELLNEKIYITDETLLETVQTVYDALQDFDGELKGKQAFTYAYLCDQLEL